MEYLIIDVINVSISAGWLALAIFALRLIFRKAPRSITVLMWGLLGLRLVLPLSFESALSLLPTAKTIPDNIFVSPAPSVTTGVPALNVVINPAISTSLAPTMENSINPAQVAAVFVAAVWVLGIIAMLIYAAVSFIRVRLWVREAAILSDGTYVCDRIPTPFILGVIKPRIYLPSDIRSEDSEYVKLHERAHLERFDHLSKLLGFLLLTVHWFNPIIWIAYLLFCKDIELACDERVIKNLDINGRKSYALALVDCSAKRISTAVCPLAFGEVGVKSRVRSVLSYKKPALWLVIAALIVSIVIGVGFITVPRESAKLDELLESHISGWIAHHHRSDQSADNFRAIDYRVIGTEQEGDKITVYAWVLYNEYVYDGEVKVDSGAHTLTVITAHKYEDYYDLIEYWTPKDGALYKDSIKEKVPAYLWPRAFNSQRYIKKQEAALKAKAEAFFGTQLRSTRYDCTDIMYNNGMFSSVFYIDSMLPSFLVTDELSLIRIDGNMQITEIGKLEQTELTEMNFDKNMGYIQFENGLTAKQIRENCDKAYLVTNEEPWLGTYYLLIQNSGEVYIAEGYTDEKTIIRHIFLTQKKAKD